jgi:glutamate---cysteine ligase / carboxylate-amine ligase
VRGMEAPMHPTSPPSAGTVDPAVQATRSTTSGPACTVGVEEEFLVVDLETRALTPRAPELIAGASSLGDHVCAELNLCQIEVDTPVCTDLAEVGASLRSLRHLLRDVGQDLGVTPAATATHPFSSWRQADVDLGEERYERMTHRFRRLAHEHVICGCHVHVGIEDPVERFTVLQAARAWVPTLLALSANSPYWQGEDTGYASYRTVVFSRWPTAGMPPDVTSPDELEALIADLKAVDAIEDETHLYWWVRPSLRHPTVEFRVCDTFLFVDDAVAVAGLIRGLCWTALHEPDALGPVPHEQVLRSAMWRAARHGMRRDLVDPWQLTTRPAQDVVRDLLDAARPGLAHFGDEAVVDGLVSQLLVRDTGASAQRLTRAEEESGEPVVDMILDRMAL